jgi:hypothetical protein
MGGYRRFCPRRLFTSQLPRQVLNLKSMPLARYANAFKERDVANYTTGQRVGCQGWGRTSISVIQRQRRDLHPHLLGYEPSAFLLGHTATIGG